MKYLMLFLLFPAGLVWGQSADSYYHKAASQYIHEKNAEAKQLLAEGIAKYPTDPQLNALKKFLKEEEKKKQDQQKKDQEKKDQEKKDQDKKDQEKKDQEKKDQKDKQDQKKDQKQNDKEKKDKEKQEKDQQKKDQQEKDKKDEKNPNLSEKLKDMKISEDKAKMILEAMKNQEVQYLQQNKRKATKPKNSGKPDW